MLQLNSIWNYTMCTVGIIVCLVWGTSPNCWKILSQRLWNCTRFSQPTFFSSACSNAASSPLQKARLLPAQSHVESSHKQSLQQVTHMFTRSRLRLLLSAFDIDICKACIARKSLLNMVNSGRAHLRSARVWSRQNGRARLPVPPEANPCSSEEGPGPVARRSCVWRNTSPQTTLKAGAAQHVFVYRHA